MNAPRMARSTQSPATLRGNLGRPVCLCIGIVVLLLASRGAEANDWVLPNLKGATWTRSVGSGQPTRLPPVDSAAHTSATNEQASESDNNLFIGYDGGFVIANHGRNSVSSADFPYLMRVNSWFQLRHSLFESDGPNADQNTISFERLRLSFGGHVFAPELQYFFQFDGGTDRSTEVIFLDYFVTYDLGRDVFGCQANTLGIKVGKWKVPFSRSRKESGRLLQFTDRATANIFFDLNRSIGAGILGQLDPFAIPIHYETAVFNGFRTGRDSTNRGEGLDRNFGWSLRSHTDLFSEFGDDGEPDLSWHELPTLRMGGGIAYTRVDAEGENEFSRQRVVDSGATLASLLPTDVTAYDVWLYTVDTHFKYRGFALIVDYFWRYMTQFNAGDVASLCDHGFVLQTGYFICPETLELLFRWSRIVGDSETLGLANRSSDEVAAGFAWYIKGHNAKLVMDVTRINGVPVSSARLDMLPGDAGWMLRTQFQLAF